MCAIETKQGSRGNFKPIIKMLATTANFALIEVGCKYELVDFIVHNFKLDMVEAPYMCDSLRDITKLIKSNKQCLTFFYDP